MAFERPTLTEIESRVRADVRVHLTDSDPELRRGNLRVLSRAQAGAVHGLYGLAERLSLQILADSAELEILERHAGIWGITRKSATKASGQATFTGTNGAEIPAGAELKRADNAKFITTSSATIAGGSADVGVEAELAGADGNTEASSGLTLLSYASGVNPRGLVTSDGLSGGADQESDSGLRSRVITRIQEPPHGGAQSDYVTWALEVSGVTRAWTYPNRLGVGTVGVTFLMDGKEDLLPTVDEVQAVQDYIDERRPVTAAVSVFAVTAAPVAFEIQLKSATGETIQAAIQASLEDLFLRESEPEGTLLISHIREAISQAAGEIDHVLVSPTSDQNSGAGELLTLGEITWS